MSSITTGIVTNGLVVPAAPLPEGAHVEIHLQANRSEASPEPARLTPTQMRELPREQRRAILAKAAELAEQDYREDKNLTGFDAFSEELDDDSE